MFSPRSESLREWHESIGPTVATLVTEEADLACRKNGLSFEGLVSAFSRLADLQQPFRSVSTTYTINSLLTRFTRSSGLEPTSVSSADTLLSAAVELRTGEDGLEGKVARVKHGADGVPSAANPRPEQQEWWSRFRRVLESSLECEEHDLMQCPAVVMLVVSTTEASGDAMACFEELSSPRYLPLPYQTGQYDPTSVNYMYVLLHDNCKGVTSQVDPDAILRVMRATLPPGQCRLLSINSLPPESPNLGQPNIWGESGGDVVPLVESSGADEVLGRFLSPEDLVRVAEFVEDVVRMAVVPAMERRIVTLNTVVSNVRKGIKNVVKSWWRKPRDAPQDAVDRPRDDIASRRGGAVAVAFRYDCIESQIRLLADSAFIMQDYESALRMYKMVRDDFRGSSQTFPKSLLHFASAAEMAAMSSVLYDTEGNKGTRRDLDNGFSVAMEAYERCSEEGLRAAIGGDAATRPELTALANRLATRSAVLYSELRALGGFGTYIQEPAFVEVADILIRASLRESPLCRAVLLESAAWRFAQAHCLRKYAFHLIMAGHMWRTSGHMVHAVRCYASALGSYHGKGWNAVQAHVHSMLAHSMHSLGRPAVALQFFLRLLIDSGGGSSSVTEHTGTGKTHQSPEHQESFMQAFISICSASPEAARLAAREWESSHGEDLSVLVERGIEGETGSPSESEVGAPPTDSGVDLLGLQEDFGQVEEKPVLQPATLDDESGPEIVFEDLPLPLTLDDTVEMVESGNAAARFQTTPPLPSPAVDTEEMLQSLLCELAAAESVAKGEGPWLDVSVGIKERARKEVFPPKIRPGRPCTFSRRAVAEPLSVRVRLKNPLAIPTRLVDLQLICCMRQCPDPETPRALQDAFFQEVPCLAFSALPGTAFDAQFSLESSGQAQAAPPPPPAAAAAAAVAASAAVAVGVVDTQDLILGPGQVVAVTLRAAPLVAGVLQICGIRWRIFSNSNDSIDSSRVWGSHRFAPKGGRLLQDSREERATRARASDLSLYSAVLGPMPWLGCELKGFPSSLLQGETCRRTLSLTNHGNAPAGHVIIKANLPWVSFEENQPPASWYDSSQSAAMGGAVGASGTVLRPPVGTLEPGQTAEVAVWLRGRGGGKHTLHFLLTYRRVDLGEGGNGEGGVDGMSDMERLTANLGSATTKGAPFLRTLLLSHEMCVFPSLSVAASVLPSYNARGEYVLSLEITNHKDEGGVKLRTICALSCFWRMEFLAGEDRDEVTVHRRERVTLHFRLFPALGEGGGATRPSADPFPISRSICALHAGPGAGVEPQVQLLCLEQAASVHSIAQEKHEQQLVAEEAAASSNHPQTIQAIRREANRKRALVQLHDAEKEREREWRLMHHAHPTSLSALCSPGASVANLMIAWGVGEKDDLKAGQHHVRGLVIRPLTVERQCPLVLTVKYPPLVGTTDLVGVDVCITNRLAGAQGDVRFVFEVRPDDGARELATSPPSASPAAHTTGAVGGTKPGTGQKRPQHGFVWVGPTRRSVSKLSPGDSCVVALKALFLRPGVYDLNRFRFSVDLCSQRPQQGKIVFVFPAKFNIRAADAAAG